MNFTVEEGGSTTSQTIDLSTNDGTYADYVIVSNASWLTVTPTSGLTPDTLTVSVDATGLTAGTYTATITASANGYVDDSVTVTLTVTSIGTGYDLLVSTNTDRSNPVLLDGETVSGNVYIFVSPESGIQRVSFYLDDPQMNGTPRQVENYAPYDFAGTGVGNAANPFDTTQLPDGTHEITALIELTTGTTDIVSSVFTVDSTAPFVKIVNPKGYDLYSSPTLYVQTIVGNLENGWGVKIILDKDDISEQNIILYSEPFEAIFQNIEYKEHTIDVYIIDQQGSVINGLRAHDRVSQIGIGDYYVAIGDSITEGYGDDNPTDDISQDGRNNGGGFEPILNDLLTAQKGYPHTVVNEGVGGTTSADGLSTINSILDKHPEAKYILIQYGTNDARPWLPVPSGLGLTKNDPDYPGTFKDNMQRIIDAINSRGKMPILAKPPITLGDSTNTTPYPDPDQGQRSLLIKEYNQVIDELVNDPSNNITITPPDFYSYFNSINPATGNYYYEEQYADNLHPNGDGYRSMAEIWLSVLSP